MPRSPQATPLMTSRLSGKVLTTSQNSRLAPRSTSTSTGKQESNRSSELTNDDCKKLKEIMDQTNADTVDNLYLNIEYNELITSEGLKYLLEGSKRFKNLRVWDLFLRGVDEFNGEDCRAIAATLDQINTSRFERFSLSALKTKIEDEGLGVLIDKLATIPSLQDVHLSVGQTGLGLPTIEHLSAFLERTRGRLKRFDVSTMW